MEQTRTLEKKVKPKKGVTHTLAQTKTDEPSKRYLTPEGAEHSELPESAVLIDDCGDDGSELAPAETEDPSKRYLTSESRGLSRRWDRW